MFTITIVKNTTEERPAGCEWKVVGKRENGTDRFDYTPEIIKKKEVGQTIYYEQTVENLDLKAVSTLSTQLNDRIGCRFQPRSKPVAGQTLKIWAIVPERKENG